MLPLSSLWPTDDRLEADWVRRPGRRPGADYYYRRLDGTMSLGAPDLAWVATGSVFSSPGFWAEAPLKAYFDFTNRCNLTCKHCITSSSPDVDTSAELSVERITRLIAELAEIGVLELATGGGEPLIHRSWRVLFGSVVDVGMNLIITTNGLLLSRSTCKDLMAISPLEVRVSFDGGPAQHEHVRGHGTYKRALRGLEMLASEGVNTTARLTLCRDGLAELPSLFADLSRIGATAIKIAVAKPVGRAATEIGTHLVGESPSIEVAQSLVALGEAHGLQVQLSADDFPMSVIDARDPKLRDTETQSCGAGLDTCHITPRGEILGCIAIPNIGFGQLRDQSFREAWESRASREYRREAGTTPTRRLCDATNLLQIGLKGYNRLIGNVSPLGGPHEQAMDSAEERATDRFKMGTGSA